ncbi:MAG: beta-lactamase family protein [bacterium]|nr:beta-lactamase family protein [bacterium]
MTDGFDTARLRDAVAQEISAGLRACQVAVALNSEIIWTESFGTADAKTRFSIASATKPIVASAIWLLIGDGLLDVSRPVVDYIPEFGANGKQAVSVEQVLLMTCGFPSAVLYGSAVSTIATSSSGTSRSRWVYCGFWVFPVPSRRTSRSWFLLRAIKLSDLALELGR